MHKKLRGERVAEGNLLHRYQRSFNFLALYSRQSERTIPTELFSGNSSPLVTLSQPSTLRKRLLKLTKKK